MKSIYIAAIFASLAFVSCAPPKKKSPKGPKVQQYRVDVFIDQPGRRTHQQQYYTTDPTGGIITTPIDGMPGRWRYSFPDGDSVIGGEMTARIIKWN